MSSARATWKSASNLLVALAWAMLLAVAAPSVANAGLHRIPASAAEWDAELNTAVFAYNLAGLDASELIVSAALEVGVVPETDEELLPIVRMQVVGGTGEAPTAASIAASLASGSGGEQVPTAAAGRVAVDLTGRLVGALSGEVSTIWVAARVQGAEFTPAELVAETPGPDAPCFLAYTRRTEPPAALELPAGSFGLQQAARPGVAPVPEPAEVAATSPEQPPTDRHQGSVGSVALLHPSPLTAGPCVRFSLRRQDRVVLEVFDLAGRRVTRRDLGVLDAGEHEVSWGEGAGSGASVARGVYFARLRGTGWSADQKVTVLR